jgi:NAD(P)-dependent dehydrogenase (short-subunit alcohol dehydrogenase family)
MNISDQVAVVTGAGVGTGRAIGERLAARGAAVALTDVDPERGAEALRTIRAGGGRAAFHAADLTDDRQVESVVDFAVDTFGGIDILVNNAGGGGHVPPHFPAAEPDRWGAILDLNLRAPLLATQLALASLASGGGTVVNIGSTAGLGDQPYRSAEYGAAKAGLMRATSCLAHLRDSHGVRVNCVAPDWVATERALREVAALDPDERAGLAPLIGLDRLCDEVVALIEDDTAAGRVVVLARPEGGDG